ncbi:glycosyltransferase family 4 protein [Vallitalea pronyensis]|uniref:Glycosyltransferase family 4 protein n=1 Tax=Vallitalea pronyensis TaxID=1348613 RepID=A0A8J8SFQ9_9FIRM|nr:glycosyltransferase family 4 protein [Vallitalea pronyensis]QUI21955.1 glycosyltransferase family 4 protein [Vallitalea pronyensis]
MTILVLANFGMGLFKFRKELLEALINERHEVYLSLPHDDYVSALEKIGCKCVKTPVDRRGTNPLKDVRLLLKYIHLIRRIQPDVVLTYTIKPNVYGGIACRITHKKYITNITGLGTSVENKGFIQKLSLALYKIGLKKASCIFFQNEPNKQLFMDRKMIKSKTRLIPGSGVNVSQYGFEPYPEDKEKINFLFIGRMMKAKGIDELLEAAKLVKMQYAHVHFDLVGGSEEDYFQQLVEHEILGIITYHGQQKDVKPFIKRAHAIILPSHHEGMANVLLESASSGRPVLASNVTGCIETFDDAISGISFEAKRVDCLVEAMVTFIKKPYEQKKAMGIAGRRKMEKVFDRRIVMNAYLEEIDNCKEN